VPNIEAGIDAQNVRTVRLFRLSRKSVDSLFPHPFREASTANATLSCVAPAAPAFHPSGIALLRDNRRSLIC
jgi:hypothetical protein